MRRQYLFSLALIFIGKILAETVRYTGDQESASVLIQIFIDKQKQNNYHSDRC